MLPEARSPNTDRRGFRHWTSVRILVLIVALQVFAVWTFAQTIVYSDEESSVGTAQVDVMAPPDRVITLGSPYGTRVLAKPGSSLLYVSESRTSINIWSLLTTYWPETITLGVTLPAAFVLWRLLRRRRVPGQPYCRKCNYQLTALPTAERCPECGVSLIRRRPVIGRSRTVWITLAAVTIVLFPILYGSLFRLLPRVGLWSQWQQWWSTPLYEFANSHQITWLTDHAQMAWYLTEVDPANGQTLRIVLTNATMPNALMSTADGSMLLAIDWRNGLFDFDPTTGRRHSTAIPLEATHGFTLVGYCTATRTAYIISMDDESLYSFNTIDSTLKKLAHIDHHKKVINPPGAGMGSSMTFKPPLTCGVPSDHRRFIVTEVQGETSIRLKPRHFRQVATHKIMLFDGVAGEQVSVLADEIAASDLAAAPDGRMLFAAVGGQGILAWDLDRPERELIVVIDDDVAKSLEHIEISPNGRFLCGITTVYSSMKPMSFLHVLDLAGGDWVEHRSVPAGWFTQSCCFTGDSRHAIATASTGGMAGGQQILIYDVANRAAQTPGDASAPTFEELAKVAVEASSSDGSASKSSLRRALLSDLLIGLPQSAPGDPLVEEIISRVGGNQLSEAEYSALFEFCAQGDTAARPLSKAWKAKYGRIIKEATEPGLSLRPDASPLGKAKDMLYPIPLDVSITVRDPWPMGAPPVLQARMENYWPWPTGHRVLATPRLPDAQPVWISGPAGIIKLPPLEAGQTEVTIDLRIDQLRQSEPGADWREVEQRTVTVPLRVGGTVEDALAPAQSPEMDKVLQSGLKYQVGDGWVNFDHEATKTKLFEGVAFGVVMEFVLNGQVVAIENHWWLGGADPPPTDREWGPGTRSPWDPQPGEVWTIRIRSDPLLALRVPEAKRYWVGDITIPLESK